MRSYGGPLHCGHCRVELKEVSLPGRCPTCRTWLTVTMPYEIYRTLRPERAPFTTRGVRVAA